jgi:hypothetical protein
MIIKSNLVDIENKEIYPAEILIENHCCPIKV